MHVLAPHLGRTRPVALAGLVLVLVLVACGGAEESGTPAAPDVAPSATTTTDVSDGATTTTDASDDATAGSGDATATPPSDATPADPATQTGGSAAASGDAAPDADAEGDPAWQEVAGGLDEPAAMLVDPRTGEDLVVQLGGRIVRLDGTTVLDLSDRLQRQGEQGLLDAAVTPDGSGLVVHYSAAGDGHTVVSWLPVADGSGGLADPDAEQVLLTFDQPATNHNGGSVVFGADGMLYVALGDGGRANDAFGNGADPGTPLGAILRVDVTSEPGTVVVPSDNPFVDGGGDERVWAHGVRNPWRIATDGEQWYVADVGQDAVEEVTVVPATTGPHDLGWPDWEGDFCRVEVCESDSLQPVATLTHQDGACSIIGAAVARTPAVDDGTVYWTDFCDTRVWRLDPASGDVVADAPMPDGVPAYALDVDADGGVVALTTDGRVLRRTRG